MKTVKELADDIQKMYRLGMTPEQAALLVVTYFKHKLATKQTFVAAVARLATESREFN